VTQERVVESAKAAPIFIIGTERSGSNLLRLILNTHSQIAAPHPPHFMAYFGHRQNHYGDLEIDANFERLLDDLLAHAKGHIHPWPFELRRSEVEGLIHRRNVFAASYAFYDLYAMKMGKPIWACKSTFMIDYCECILANFPRAKLIWLVRDPRDVALSSTKSVFNPYHPYYTAKLWRRQQETGLKLELELPDSNFRRVHYEDLVREPTQKVQEICNFVGVKFEKDMLDYFGTFDAQKSASLSQDWQNTRKPILRYNSGKFNTGLTPSDIAIVEEVTSPIMEILGYENVAAAGARTAHTIPQLVQFRIKNEILRWTAEFRSITGDKNGWRRWQRAIRMALLSVRLRYGQR
jgi:hypothetical protein